MEQHIFKKLRCILEPFTSLNIAAITPRMTKNVLVKSAAINQNKATTTPQKVKTLHFPKMDFFELTNSKFRNNLKIILKKFFDPRLVTLDPRPSTKRQNNLYITEQNLAGVVQRRTECLCIYREKKSRRYTTSK